MESEIEGTLKDKVTIITGAGSGIGRACAKLLFSQRSKVVLVEFNPDSLKNVMAELEAIGDAENILSLQMNVCRETDMNEMANQTLLRFGRIDNLIASAGILRISGTLKTVVETSLEEWQAVIQTNLTGTFLSNRAVLPVMIAQKQGDIINISSVSGRQGRAFDAPYCASKFGIIGLSESIAEEVAAYGVRVQTILPDSVDTPLWDQNGVKSIKAPVTIPAERVAELILYLLRLPKDAYLLNPVIAPFKGRKKRSKLKDV
ncbi:SDR family oxidoreductase [Planktothrix sp. FACHB-1355]|uniref:SDR family oxidoreductase n=1 Tax=Aerosakkonema funiforme FACHB-1375 TaxID=2949571 RepID=A0A926ZI32_9CYAN|nr:MULTISPECIES: SDR family NAD(P)-dependent oxidoreductase [Oscillatoriales]MBD2183264.1 SDR family oxidoreductase [Aerosakkonema funiforme FACHB-1375]MBD3560746.1 SDR family oxidoreductase [Planktothrix sp. FACHB-1355]